MTITLDMNRGKNIRKDFRRALAMKKHEDHVSVKRSEMKLEIKALRSAGEDEVAEELHRKMVKL